MARSTPADTYNYAAFRPAPYVEGGCDGPAPGEHLGVAEVRRLEGRRVTLEDVARGLLVLETGSVTCPLYRANVAPMRDVAAAHPDVTFAVLYTREAHPGERRGPHRDDDDKGRAAASLRAGAGEWREVLVDDIDGSLHRRLAGAPDSLLILGADGTVAAWMHDADPKAVDVALSRLEAGLDPSGVRGRFRPPPLPTALRALGEGGILGILDFVRGLPRLARYRLAGGADC